MHVTWDDREKTIVRNLLIQGWPALSRGDRSIIFLAQNSIDHRATTSAGTAHADFWESLIGLGWAERYEPDLGVPLPDDFRVFGFNAKGLRLFPPFVEHFSLRTIIVREEQREDLEQLQKQVDVMAAQLMRLSCPDLAGLLPGEGTQIICEIPYRYLAVTWDAAWLGGNGDLIEIKLRGFLHPGHHRPLCETNRTVRKPGIAPRLFGH